MNVTLQQITTSKIVMLINQHPFKLGHKNSQTSRKSQNSKMSPQNRKSASQLSVPVI